MLSNSVVHTLQIIGYSVMQSVLCKALQHPQQTAIQPLFKHLTKAKSITF